MAPLLVALLLSATGPKGAARDAALLARAVRLIGDLDDRRAALVLRQLLVRHPPAPIAAKAHVYLGLIELNALREPAALAEFQWALRTDPGVTLPFDASPKASPLFEKARPAPKALARVQPASKADALAPAASAEGTPPSALSSDHPEGAPRWPPEESSPAATDATAPPVARSHAAAYVVGGLGLAALALGGILGLDSNGALASARSATDTGASQALAARAGSYGRDADVAFGAGGALVVASVLLFAIHPSGSSAVVGAVPLRGGGALAVGGSL
ncbi:MAG: hypothetical protein ACYCWW_05260 [Deltaproteobacteria bacterium]